VRRAVPFVASSLLVLLASGPTRARGDEMQVITIDHDDVEITRSTLVRPGTYHVVDRNGDGVIHVRGSSLTLDLAGVVLDGAKPGEDPSRFDGIGVSIAGGADVRVHGGACRGFRVGLRAEGTEDLHLDHFDGSGNRRDRLKSTPEAEDASDWLWPQENDDGQWETRYGAAISLVGCRRPIVWDCRAHDGQNGLLLDGCERANVQGNDFSFNSGWGVALWRSSDGSFTENRCDFCVRGYSHGVYARGQDSTGFLVFEQCSGNRFGGNTATHSGDGFFLYAGNEALKRTGSGGCNRNVLDSNDFSHAVANGIEATFSEGNVFSENRLLDCDHGIWAGYSSYTWIEHNQVGRCANGVSIEHGVGNRILRNEFSDCRVGVHLWWDDDEDLLTSAFGRTHPGAPSARNTIERNGFVGGSTAIRLDGDASGRVLANTIDGALVGLHLSGAARRPLVRENRFRLGTDAVAARSDDGPGWLLGPNDWGAAAPAFVGEIRRRESMTGAGPAAGAVATEAFAVRSAPSRHPSKSAIFCDEWGPLRPDETRIVRPWGASTGSPRLYVRGDGVPFTAESLDPAFEALPAEGRAPATITVKPKEASTGPGRAFAPYALRVRAGDLEETVRGTTWALPWRVRFFEWTKDPREDREAYAALVAGPATDEVTMPTLDGAWPGRPTPKVRADRFATVAEAKGLFDAGRYVLHVRSDDGVRVLVDGKVVLEDWTWHGPKDEDVAVDLAAGEHALRVEHFELDGYAALRLSVEPAP
jgi:parallel beta-helix repeat protein